MAQMKITTEDLHSFVRSLDERLIDKRKYPDSWLDDKIDKAYELTATQRQSFYAEEVLDLTEYIIDGTQKFQVDMDGDVLGYKRIFTNTKTNDITWHVNVDQSLEIYLNTDRLSGVEHRITFQYYYVPKTATNETYMSADVYRMLQQAIKYSVWDAIRDFDKSAAAFQEFKASTTTVINGLDIDANTEGWNGGFY